METAVDSGQMFGALLTDLSIAMDLSRSQTTDRKT